MDFGEWVAIERKKRGFELRQLARYSGINPGTLSRMERGLTSATLASAVRIVDVFGKSSDELLKELGYSVFIKEPTRIKTPPTGLTWEDIEAFYDFYLRKHDEAQKLLVDYYDLITHLMLLNQTHPLGFGETNEIVDKLMTVEDDFMFRNYFPFSEIVDVSLILAVFNQGGLLIGRDVWGYFRLLKPKGRNPARFKEIWLDHQQLFREGVIDSVKINSLIKLQQEFGPEKQFFQICWEACRTELGLVKKRRYLDKNESNPNLFGAWSVKEWRIIVFLLNVNRHVQCFDPDPVSWLSQFRQTVR